MEGQAIRIVDLEKRFDRTHVLRKVNLDIDKGEFLTLLGASGCGKSTLLRLIAGFEPASAGRIVVGERDIAGLPPKARNVAMVFQSYALYPHMSVGQNVGMPLEMGRLSMSQRLPGMKWVSPAVRRIRAGIASDVETVARQLDLEHLLDRKPSQLSGGQRQRVAVGRAMVRQPSVFLMDEPLSNLDAKLRIQLREEISDLHRRTGITFIYVTHDQTEAMAMSSRIALMEAGQITQCATPGEIYNSPERLSVARFVGSSAINEISVQARAGDFAVAGARLNLSAPGLADGTYTLAVRPEALHLEQITPDFELPVAQVEFTGAEVGIRCHGASLGTDWIRVQVRASDYAALRQRGTSDETIGLRIADGTALLFDSDGKRVPIVPVALRQEAAHVACA